MLVPERAMSVRVVLEWLLDWDRRLSAHLARPLETPSGHLGRIAHRMATMGARLGDGLLWAIVGGVSYILSGSEARKGILIIASTAVLAGMVVWGVKALIRRQRPATLEERTSFYYASDSYAFPSGHACRMACIAVTAGALDPRVTIPLIFLASWVMASRVLLGVHHVLDIVAGGLIGAGVGSLARYLFLAS